MIKYKGIARAAQALAPRVALSFLKVRISALPTSIYPIDSFFLP
jgi:hypothetical protein